MVLIGLVMVMVMMTRFAGLLADDVAKLHTVSSRKQHKARRERHQFQPG